MTDDTLPAIHAAWQAHLNAMVAAGTAPADAIEAMLTVGIAAKSAMDGPVAAASALLVVARHIGGQDHGVHNASEAKH